MGKMIRRSQYAVSAAVSLEDRGEGWVLQMGRRANPGYRRSLPSVRQSNTGAFGLRRLVYAEDGNGEGVHC